MIDQDKQKSVIDAKEIFIKLFENQSTEKPKWVLIIIAFFMAVFTYLAFIKLF